MQISPLIDIGLNLAHESFDHDRAEVIRRAADVGVSYMLITGSSLASTREAVQTVRNAPSQFRCTAGVHPHHASELGSDELKELESYAAMPEVVAVGECGLDYFRDLSPREVQAQAFRQQLQLAAQVGKPAFLHQRDAHEDFLAIVRELRPSLVGGVAHCFTGDLAQARDYLELDLYIGVTGWICDERRGLHLREVVREIPLDRLLLETDAPYLLPRDLEHKPRSRRNEPMYLPHILRVIATARDEPIESLAASTTENARRLFGWP